MAKYQRYNWLYAPGKQEIKSTKGMASLQAEFRGNINNLKISETEKNQIVAKRDSFIGR